MKGNLDVDVPSGYSADRPMKFFMNQLPIYADLWSATLAIPVQDPPSGYKND